MRGVSSLSQVKQEIDFSEDAHVLPARPSTRGRPEARQRVGK